MTQQARMPASQAARQAAKKALRHYGSATAALRRGPDFVIVGAKRGGTTSLHNYLMEHPAIQPLFPSRQHIKGAHFYDSNYGRGLNWYRSHFPVEIAGRPAARPGLSRSVAGDASPYYLFHPLAAQRLAADFPDVKILINLRDPVERAYSHYKEATYHGRETLSFEAALEAESERLQGEAERIVAEPGYRSLAHEHQSYLSQSRYLDMLPRWFSLFPREQFHITVSEDFYADPDRYVNEVWRFLGLEPRNLRSRTRHNHQAAPDIRPETRERLQDALADHHRDLAELLGRSLPWPASRQPAR